MDYLVLVSVNIIDANDTLIDDMHHNYKCSHKQNDKVTTTINNFQKLIQKTCRLQNVQLFGCHDNVVEQELTMTIRANGRLSE